VCFLQFEADRRALIITINSFDTELTKEDRARLFPKCGKLNPDGLAALARADDYEQVRSVAEYYAEYQNLFATAGNNPDEKTLEDRFFEHEVLPIPSDIICSTYFGKLQWRKTATIESLFLLIATSLNLR